MYQKLIYLIFGVRGEDDLKLVIGSIKSDFMEWVWILLVSIISVAIVMLISHLMLGG